MIEYLWRLIRGLSLEVSEFFEANYNAVPDTFEILVIAAGVYWLLLLLRGTRAVQILTGLLLLVAASLASDAFQLATISWILGSVLQPYAMLIIIVVLFQHDIRRALARMGRGFYRASQREVAIAIEEIVRAAQTLAEKRVGALVVIERETSLDDLVEHGTPVHGAVSKELLTALFLPYSPLHDGAVVIQGGRVAHAGSILPLTLRKDLPEGLGTRHRAAVGITEETDAVVVVVSEETGTISVVVGGEMVRDLDGPRLRSVLRDVLAGAGTGAERAEGDEQARVATPEPAAPSAAAEPGAAAETPRAVEAGAAGPRMVGPRVLR